MHGPIAGYWVSPRCVNVAMPFVSGPFILHLSPISKQFIREQRSSFPSKKNCGNIEKDIKLLLRGEHAEKQ